MKVIISITFIIFIEAVSIYDNVIDDSFHGIGIFSQNIRNIEILVGNGRIRTVNVVSKAEKKEVSVLTFVSIARIGNITIFFHITNERKAERIEG